MKRIVIFLLYALPFYVALLTVALHGAIRADYTDIKNIVLVLGFSGLTAYLLLKAIVKRKPPEDEEDQNESLDVTKFEKMFSTIFSIIVAIFLWHIAAISIVGLFNYFFGQAQ